MKEIPIYFAQDLDKMLMDGDLDTSAFAGLISKIIDSKNYDHDTEKGILLLVDDQGTNGLSERQMWVLKNKISQFSQNCQMCGNELDWEELDPYGVDIHCHGCQHRLSKEKD